MKQKILVLQGLPASGKSVWAKEFCIKDSTYVRVNRDDLRHMRGTYWLPNQENMISDWENSCIQDALTDKRNVVIDATNLNPKTIRKWEALAIKWNVELEFKLFNVPLDECIKRDNERTIGKVGEKVIRDMHNKYLANKVEFKPFTQNTSLPGVVVCDLDGTLAIHNGRNPFDYDKCDTDLVNPAVLSILINRVGTPTNSVIFMSGRDDSCEAKTRAWIEACYPLDYKLFMRKTGDSRPDDIVKHELFNEHIKDKYYVEFVLDDRAKVVKMWRALGLTCLQCAEGNF